jgi:hypothetical protein
LPLYDFLPTWWYCPSHLIHAYLLDGLFGNIVVNGAIRKVVGIIGRNRSESSGQNKIVVDLCGSMFVETVMRYIIFQDLV